MNNHTVSVRGSQENNIFCIDGNAFVGYRLGMKQKQKNPHKVLTLETSQEMYDAVTQLARKKTVSRSVIVRWAVERYLLAMRAAEPTPMAQE